MADDIKISVDHTQVDNARRSVRELGDEANRTVKKTKRFAAVGLQQVGYQAGDFAVQVQGGTNALVALGQQGSQLLGILGPFGAVAGAALAIGTSIMLAKSATKELSFDFKKFGGDMSKLFAPAKPLIDAIGEGFKWMGQMAMIAINGLITGTAKLFTIISHLPAVTKEAITRSSLWFQKLGYWMDIYGEQMNISFNNKLIDMKDGIAMWSHGVEQQFNGLIAYVSAMWQGLADKMVNTFVNMGVAVAKTIEDLLNSMVGQINKLSEAINSVLPERFKDYGLGTVGNFNFASGLQKTTVKSFGEIGEQASQAFWDAYNNTAYNIPDVSNETRIIKNAEERLFRAAEMLSRVQADLNLPNKALEDMYAALDGIQSIDLGSYFEWVAKKAKDTGDKIAHKYQSISDTIKSSMEDAFMSIVDNTSTVADAFKTMAVAIIKELYKVLVVQQIVGSYDLNKGTGSGIVGAIMSGFRAGGGPVEAGKTYVVGEKGPELFTAPSNGKITPNGQLSGGNVTVVQNINVSTGVQATVRAEIRQMMPQIAESAKGAVLDAKRRGGNYGMQVFDSYATSHYPAK